MLSAITFTVLVTLATARPIPHNFADQLDHIVILRFCLPKLGQEFHEGQCSAMLKLFGSTMLLSLRKQSANFRVLAYVGLPMPEHLRNQLSTLLAPFPHRIVSVESFFEPGHHLPPLEEAKGHLKTFLAGSTTNQHHTRITTRLDVDDLIHRDTLQNIQALHSHPRINGVLVVNQLRGYRMTFTSGTDRSSTVQCHLSPMDYPFMSVGQSLVTDANKNFSILDFQHDRDPFVGALPETAGIKSTDASSIVGAFQTVPLDRGYIYVRHALSITQNLMEMGKDAVLCDDMADELYQRFAIKHGDMRAIASMFQHANAAH